MRHSVEPANYLSVADPLSLSVCLCLSPFVSPLVPVPVSLCVLLDLLQCASFCQFVRLPDHTDMSIRVICYIRVSPSLPLFPDPPLSAPLPKSWLTR